MCGEEEVTSSTILHTKNTLQNNLSLYLYKYCYKDVMKTARMFTWHGHYSCMQDKLSNEECKYVKAKLKLIQINILISNSVFLRYTYNSTQNKRFINCSNAAKNGTSVLVR
jgi:hypothetical protein